MRFDTNNASSFFVWKMEYADIVKTVRDEGDILVLTLKTNERIMVHFVERGMSLNELHYHFRTNTSAGLHTLMIFWVDMFLPRDGADYTLPDWLMALADVHGDKVYGYEVAGRSAYFFPVHLRGTGQTRTVRYGNVVDYAQIGCQTVKTASSHLSGTWRIADFEPRGQHARTHTTDALPAHLAHLSDAYHTLGLALGADLDAVKQAYRSLARLYHPDVATNSGSHQQMKRLNEAYQRIMQARH